MNRSQTHRPSDGHYTTRLVGTKFESRYRFLFRKEGNVLFNDAINTFYLRLYGVRHMVKDHSDSEIGNPRRHIGCSFRLAARVILHGSSHRLNNTYHGLCYTSRGALVGTRNSSIGPPRRIDPTTHPTMNERSYHGATSCSLFRKSMWL